MGKLGICNKNEEKENIFQKKKEKKKPHRDKKEILFEMKIFFFI